ncbi:PREDICTED: putative methyltransferase NSUN3 isoform X2 [Chinchilla lanigera]|uniref:putative methyltransferase NSUN3 isoform X2 n=1 Tax=Chinchilla lanigera TaxID=34839 RepID=UPI000696CA16|nr:PREDICTED: putative methyltransferase NSUN3 isoform X2 [Chinchilla lanigera]
MCAKLKAKSEGKLAKQICRVVLEHFDKEYSRELGGSWSTVRDVLTSPSLWQYAVLLNRFNYPYELEKDLHLKGYQRLFQGSLPYYPKSMKCYLSRTPDRMPSERHQTGNLKKYYLLNAASLLPVLALELRDGEKVLDLCAAPGGKSVALLQCAWPGYLYCNEYDSLRLRWLKQTLESFIPQPLRNVIKVSELDGREIGDAQPETFDKVLVDAPCSNDRSWLFSSDSQMAAWRIHHRRSLPVLQLELLSASHKDEITVEFEKVSRDEQMVVWSIIDFSMGTTMIKDLELDSKKPGQLPEKRRPAARKTQHGGWAGRGKLLTSWQLGCREVKQPESKGQGTQYSPQGHVPMICSLQLGPTLCFQHHPEMSSNVTSSKHIHSQD